jgi:hypothetical protein
MKNMAKPFRDLVNLRYLKEQLLKYTANEDTFVDIIDWNEVSKIYSLHGMSYAKGIDHHEAEEYRTQVYILAYQFLAEMFYIIEHSSKRKEMLNLIQELT